MCAFYGNGQLEAVANPPALLQQIAVNLVRDFARRRKTEAAHVRVWRVFRRTLPTDEAPPEERIAHEQKSRLLRDAATTIFRRDAAKCS